MREQESQLQCTSRGNDNRTERGNDMSEVFVLSHVKTW